MLANQSPGCLAAVPGYLDDRITRLTFYLYWNARDDWGNVAHSWRTVFRVKVDPPTPTCAAPRAVQVLASGPYP